MTHVLVVRPDNAGDVLLAGPTVRAVAASTGEVTLWCGPNGAAAAALLPGVDRVLVHRADWIDPVAASVDRDRVLMFVDELASLGIDQALVLTSYHQSPLPAALLLRLAGVETIAAVCDDFPGALLDVRHRIDEDVHEVERSLSLAATLGYRLPAGDPGGLAVELPADATTPIVGGGDLVVVHPGASVSARAWAPQRYRALVGALCAAGWRVAVTGGPAERDLTAYVADGWAGTDEVLDLGGDTTLAQFADVLSRCGALVTGNTGPAHLAAAVGTPVVSLFAPTVPAGRWRPWGVPHALLGHQDIACAGCRASDCPVPGHPCIDDVMPDQAIAALRRLLSDRDVTHPPSVASASDRHTSSASSSASDRHTSSASSSASDRHTS
jgi:ADP-heptose:LPS heptosyltransferase